MGDVIEEPRRKVPASLWTMEQALAAHEQAAEVTGAAGFASDSDESRLARAVQAVLVEHMPVRERERTLFLGGVGDVVPEHAVCRGQCRDLRTGHPHPQPWPCPAVRPLLDGMEVSRG